MRFNRSSLVTASSIVLLSAALAVHAAVGEPAQHTVLRHVFGNLFEVIQNGHPLMGVHRLHVRPGFEWPRSSEAAYVANKLPKKQILAFLASGLGWPANDMPGLGEFRFALLGPKEVCLVARWYLRDAALQEVVCPAAGGGYWDTSLSPNAPGPLAWYVVDLGGNGSHEVISSRGGGSWTLPPIYWYEIYRFSDGLPQSVSNDFPGFYEAAFLPQLSAIERFINPPAAVHTTPPVWAAYENFALQFLRLKYQRRILGEKRAGFEQGLAWIKSPYNDVQGLGLGILADINDPQSIAALRKLGETTRNQGTCADVVNAVAKLEGRAPGGVVSDSADIKKILKCDEMKPSNPCLLQTGCVPPSADETK